MTLLAVPKVYLLNTSLMVKLLIVISLTLLFATNALADNDSHIIEEMIVMATTQAESEHNLAINSVQNISFTQPNHIAQSLNSLPGVRINQSTREENFRTIRSLPFTGDGSCNNFLFFENDISLRTSTFCNVNSLFDSYYEQRQRIEVLRDLNAAFQGSGAVHRSIYVISPGFRKSPETDLGIFYDSLNKRNLSLDHRSEKWISQISVTKDKGYKDNSNYTQQNILLKALQEGVNWTLIHHLNLMNIDQNTATYVTNFTQQELTKDPTLSRNNAYLDENRKRENSNTDAFKKAQSLRYNLKFNLQTDAGGEFLLTPYIHSNRMDYTLHFLPGSPLEERGHASLGLQSSYTKTHHNGWNVSTGFDFDYSRDDLKQSQSKTVNFFPGSEKNFPAGDHYDYRVNVATTALFAQVDKTIGYWNILAGIRLKHARFDYDNQLSDGNACPPDASICHYTRARDGVRHFYNWSPRASLTWQYLDQQYSYLRLSREFRTPHTRDLYRLEEGQKTANIDSEKIEAIELGFNGVITNHLAYQISSYYVQKDNVIIQTQGRLRINNQKTRHQGIEAEINYSPNYHWLLSLSSIYGKHRYNSNVNLFASENSKGEIKGNIIDNAPRHLHSLQIKWFINDNNELAFDTQYLGRYFLDAENEFQYPGHTLSHLHFRTQLVNHWKLSASIINIGNKNFAYHADITTRPNGQGEFVERYFIGEPRNIRVSLTKTF